MLTEELSQHLTPLGDVPCGQRTPLADARRELGLEIVDVQTV